MFSARRSVLAPSPPDIANTRAPLERALRRLPNDPETGKD